MTKFGKLFRDSDCKDWQNQAKSLVNKTNRRTEFHIYWYYDSTCFGQPFRPSSGVRIRTSALVHFMQFWWPFAARSRMKLHPAPGRKRSSKLYKMYHCRCTDTNSRLWAERLPETCRVIMPINLEFSASVGFVHKEFITIHGHTILKFKQNPFWYVALVRRFERTSYKVRDTYTCYVTVLNTRFYIVRI